MDRDGGGRSHQVQGGSGGGVRGHELPECLDLQVLALGMAALEESSHRQNALLVRSQGPLGHRHRGGDDLDGQLHQPLVGDARSDGFGGELGVHRDAVVTREPGRASDPILAGVQRERELAQEGVSETHGGAARDKFVPHADELIEGGEPLGLLLGEQPQAGQVDAEHVTQGGDAHARIGRWRHETHRVASMEELLHEAQDKAFATSWCDVVGGINRDGSSGRARRRGDERYGGGGWRHDTSAQVLTPALHELALVEVGDVGEFQPVRGVTRGHAFVMHHGCVGLVVGPQPQAPKFQAQVRVLVVGRLVHHVEAEDPDEVVRAQEHAGRGHVIHDAGAVERGVVGILELSDLRGESLVVQQGTGLLQQPVRVEELRTDSTAVGFVVQPCHQGLQPTLSDGDVVVHEDDVAALRGLNADVVSLAEVAVHRNPDEPTVTFERVQDAQLVVGAAVVHQDDLVAVARGAVAQGRHTFRGQ